MAQVLEVVALNWQNAARPFLCFSKGCGDYAEFRMKIQIDKTCTTNCCFCAACKNLLCQNPEALLDKISSEPAPCGGTCQGAI